MEYSFQNLNRQAPPPADGVLRLLPKDAHRLRHDLALLAAEQGIDAFLHGEEPVTRLELPAEPTLDDMLAAEIVTLRAQSLALVAGLKAFAHYAQLAREGLRPRETPLESSLEGIYQAARNSVPEDLTNHQNAAQFLEGWQRIWGRIIQAAGENADPFTARLFDDAEFARQRTYLAKDHEVYRQDLKRGERWRVQIPDGPSSASALLLRRPKSLFFKHFSREDRETPTGEPYLFLAVEWGPGDWTFSTDPVQRISLQPLAEKLQAAEAQRDAAGAAADPWSDGAAYGHTLVASPQKKSKLSDAEVLSLVKHWVFAKPVEPPRTSRRVALAALATTAAAGLAWFSLPHLGGTKGGTGGKGPGSEKDAPNRDLEPDQEDIKAGETSREVADLGQRKDYALLFATSNYQAKCWSHLPNPIPDARALKEVLETDYDFDVTLIEDPTHARFQDELAALKIDAQGKKRKYGPHDQLFVFVAGHGYFASNIDLGYVVLTNSPDPREDKELKSYMSHAELRERINRIECPHVFVAIDVCFGGSFDYKKFGNEMGVPRGGPRGIYSNAARDEFIRRELKIRCRRYLTSGGITTVTDGVPGEHSPFAARLLGVLQDTDIQDGIVTLTQIVQQTKRLGTQPSYGGLEFDQEQGDFLFIKKQVTSPSPQ